MRSFFSIIAVVFLIPAFGQKVDFNPRMQMAVGDIAHLRYKAMEHKLREERNASPENRVADYLEAAAICMDLFLNENEAGFKENEARIDYLINRLEELPEKEIYRGVMLGEIYLAKASLQGKFRNHISAGYLFYKAYNHLQTTALNHPDFVPNHVPWGVLNAAIGSLPEDYRNIAAMLGFKGDINTGMRLVKKAYLTSKSNRKYQFYQHYFGYIYVFLNHQLKGADDVDLKELGFSVSESSLFSFLQAEILLDRGEAIKALELLENRPQGAGYLPIPYIDYITGKVAMSVDRQKAPEYFFRFLKEAQNPDYFKSTYRYLAWYYLLEDNQEKAREMRSRIFSQGSSTMGADQQAVAEAQRGFNRELIQRRLEFDGGQYLKVVSVPEISGLNSCCAKNWEKLEFYYRRGRAYQEMGRVNDAIDAYLKALTFKDAEITSALGNSFLQLATLYEERGDKSRARYFYDKALEYKDYPFYEGIHQKAKTGLSRLG